ncbi:CARDB domain-containing protein [Isosphaeraceae bacterium EP7]
MSSRDRRVAERHRAWGRKPIILRFDALEGRQLMAAGVGRPDLVGTAFSTPNNLDWDQAFHAIGTITNQGDSATTTPTLVAVYASSTPNVGSTAVLLGTFTIDTNLEPGASASYDEVFRLPSTPVSGLTANQLVYVGSQIDPNHTLPETSIANNQAMGQGLDLSSVYITPIKPAELIGTAFGVSQSQVAWGSTIKVTAQVKNTLAGDAPATRARVVATPSGSAFGGAGDITLGSIAIPPVPSYQTVNVVQEITLPATIPTSVGGATTFTVTLVADADYLTNPLAPHVATQGLGLDQTVMTIFTAADATSIAAAAAAAAAEKPDLAVGAVTAPTGNVFWGQNFQVTANLQNLGKVDSGAFKVRFYLIGNNTSNDKGIFLGDTSVDNLQGGYSRDLTQTLRLPGQLPAGITLSSIGAGRIWVVVDPENTVDETFQTNNGSSSSPIVLRVMGTDGRSTVPTPVTTTPATSAANARTTAQIGRVAAANRRAALIAQRKSTPLRRQPVPVKSNNGLSIFPKAITSFLNKFNLTGSSNGNKS